MINLQEIIRLAARGDGVTADGVHVSGAVPGDLVEGTQLAQRGPHHVVPPCAHFGTCGGCNLQHADNDVLSEFARDRVINSAKGQGLSIDEVLPVHLSPPASRRRATLHAVRTKGGQLLGFREGGSHKLVDLQECHILRPELSDLVNPLRAFLRTYASSAPIDVALSLSDQGVDVGIRKLELEGLEATEAALKFAGDNGLARLAIDQGYGAETIWEPDPVTISFSGVRVSMPTGSFLQATIDAETRIITDVQGWINGCGLVADLFAGLGTFAFSLRQNRKVLAVEADQAAHLACKAAGTASGGTVLSMHRDLFRNPLQAEELNRFDAVVLDPPRAGAKAQIGELAESALSRLVYVSCNPSSWARDAARLCESGFRLKKLRPVAQFRWSTHVELVSLFER